MEPDPVIVFDTDCVLCSAWTHFFLAREARPTARFVSAWTDEGAAIAAAHGIAPEALDLTFLVVQDGRGFTQSDAVIALIGHLRAPWRWLAALRIIPRSIRDRLYRLLAQNRYRLFGRRAHCFIAPPDQRGRFVDGSRLASGQAGRESSALGSR